jgi:hypothetical protein
LRQGRTPGIRWKDFPPAERYKSRVADTGCHIGPLIGEDAV